MDTFALTVYEQAIAFYVAQRNAPELLVCAQTACWHVLPLLDARCGTPALEDARETCVTCLLLGGCLVQAGRAQPRGTDSLCYRGLAACGLGARARILRIYEACMGHDYIRLARCRVRARAPVVQHLLQVTRCQRHVRTRHVRPRP